MAQWRLSRQAERDLDAIWLFSADRFGTEQADRMLERLEEQFRLLAAQPRSGRARDDVRPGLRSVAIESYLIFYRVSSPGVRIIRIWHGRQDPSRLKSEL
jgi:toxin ParE1/3/4